MTAKSRIKNLSTRFHWLYKNGSLLVLSGVICFFVYGAYQNVKEQGIMGLFLPFTYVYLIWIWYWVNRRVYRTEFDEEFLIVIRKNQDTLIPLENIKDVEIVSLGGMYKVNLFHAEDFGDCFYFKPSLFYPLNYKTKDALVNLLRNKIEAAKQKKYVLQRNALHS